MTADEGRLASPDAIVIEEGAQHTDEWKEKTAGVDRVISIALTIKQPRTADWVADKVGISPTTARAHLERLVDLHVLSAVEQRGAKTYYPDGAYQRFREVSKLVEEYTHDEIEEITIGAKEEVEELRETYDVETPDELRKLATAEETSSAEAREYFKKASEWDSHLHMISMAEDALERYGEFSDPYQQTVDSAA